jgi:hypothetical protein
MTTKSARCKFCNVPLYVEFDEECLTFIRNESWWLSLAACNRCADHRTIALNFAEKAGRIGGRYTLLWNSGVRDGEKIEKIKTSFERLSKRFVGIIALHYRQTNYWDPGWLDLLLEKPHRAKTIFLAHENQMRREAEKFRAERLAQTE